MAHLVRIAVVENHWATHLNWKGTCNVIHVQLLRSITACDMQGCYRLPSPPDLAGELGDTIMQPSVDTHSDQHVI